MDFAAAASFDLRAMSIEEMPNLLGSADVLIAEVGWPSVSNTLELIKFHFGVIVFCLPFLEDKAFAELATSRFVVCHCGCQSKALGPQIHDGVDAVVSAPAVSIVEVAFPQSYFVVATVDR